jgi:flagellar assembly factor FliW
MALTFPGINFGLEQFSLLKNFFGLFIIRPKIRRADYFFKVSKKKIFSIKIKGTP